MCCIKPIHCGLGVICILRIKILDMINKNKSEVMSINRNLNQNGAIRVMKYKTVFDKMLSTHFSCAINDVVDVHTINDLKKIEN